ncbi:T-cell surface glycoprotein CD8 alpha chain isoform X1 [Thunnus albacares]|uniref:T-cell surface glycoprotein CD8 alpha chain isoform X1 n=2 Tax=Thunnus albacares TaxID=8236 RepID=UPI001CF6A993|nr:T-cell surface glycoprotein CD8 alpha chain isoform X1 [Thunnus albacares]
MISYSRLRQTARRRVQQLIVVCKIKMDQKWIRVLVVLVFCQKMSSTAVNVKTLEEGASADIKCDPNAGQSIVIWYRMLDTSRMEFIGSFTNGIEKTQPSSNFTYSKIDSNTITLTSFNKIKDSGTYTCAAFKSNRLIFGQVTRLQGVETAVATKAPPTTTTKQLTTTTPCACNGKNKKVVETSLSEICSPIILGPLAGSCGLLLLLLIIISVYCSRIRTRRCPHHYKRKPRTVAPEKQMMTNRHV